ncbi:MAG: PD-(D/E)XK nuclease family protein [Balneolales bacterium]
MIWKREITGRDPADLWKLLMKECAGSSAIVLVNNLLMVRELRKKWQNTRQDFAPDIRTLESWLDELALHSIDEKDIPKVVLTAGERTLWLEQWLSSHNDPEFRRFSGMKPVTAISNIIGNLYQADLNPGALFNYFKQNAGESENSQKADNLAQDDEHGSKQVADDRGISGNTFGHGHLSTRRRYLLAELLNAYEKQITENGWLDREQLIGKMTQINSHVLRHDKVLFYFIDELNPLQLKVLKRIADDKNSPEFVSVRFEIKDKEELFSDAIYTVNTKHYNTDWNASDAPSDSLSPPNHLFREVFHHPREELEQSIRQMLAHMSHFGNRFDDYVILTGDLSLYEWMVESVSKRFQVPLYASRGLSLISHSFIRRLLSYLKLEQNDFPVDDVFRIFADNRVVLPELKDHDDQKPPNIRHFSQFCREHNFRTLKEVSGGIDRVFDWLLERIHYEDDEDREDKRRAGLQRDRDFYKSVIRHLETLRRYYMSKGQQSLKEWVKWATRLLALQKDFMSRQGNEARELLDSILEKLEKAQDRLGLDRKMTQQDFFRLLELRLKEERERPLEMPGGVLLTEIRHMPDVHDKIVFVLGLHEDGFPKPDRPDFFQFRYENALQKLTGRDGTELYDLARLQLQRLLASGRTRYLSRPALIEQKQVMPSPLWLELEDQIVENCQMKKESGEEVNVQGWPEMRTKWLMCEHDMGMMAAEQTNRSMVINKNHSGSEMLGTDEAGRISGSQGLADGITSPESRDSVKYRSDRFQYAFQLAALMESSRKNTLEMGRYDGMIDNEVANQWWDQQISRGYLPMSISRLDTFATSPLDYFFKYILRLKPVHEYRDEADPNIKGGLLHHILQDFYSKTPEEGPPVWPPDDPDASRLRMSAIRKRLTEVYRYQLGNPESPFPGILEKNLERITRWFLEREMDRREEITEGLDDVRPAVFYPQFKINMEHRWSFEKLIGNIMVEFRGMIDRIDLSPDGQRGLILDYKSGRSGVKKYVDILNGGSFQLPVYGMYMRKTGVLHFLAGYYQLPINGKLKDVKTIFALGSAELIKPDILNTSPRSAGPVRRKINMVQFKPLEELEAFMKAIENLRISWIIQAIREGRFHVSLTGEPKWSDFIYISRHDERIQQQRQNRELSLRNKKKMVFELDRYYLSVPFLEENHE